MDVAYSFEVAEHLPPNLGTRLVRFLLETAPTVVFTAAHPGQGGQGHINEQSREYWAHEFERAGGMLDTEATATLAALFSQRTTLEWLAHNVQVFRRTTALGSESGD